MQKITPFLWFNTQAEEAANFYVKVFSNSPKGADECKILNISKYPDGVPGLGGQVMTAEFELHGLKFIGLNGGPEFNFTEAISFSIDCDSQEEVDYFWNKLTADGGQESQCAWLKDKFGVSWQVVPQQLGEYLGGADAAGAGRAMQAMLQMKKIDIAKLKEAYEGK